MRFSLRTRLYDCDIKGVACDSRMIQSDGVFCALNGAHTDGHRFVDHAISSGASVVVHSRRNIPRATGVSYIFCRKPQLFMSACAHVLYGRPSEAMCVIGITGTDGKSSTAYLAYQMLRLLGVKCGLISTVMVDDGDGSTRLNAAHRTTPEAPQLHRALSTMRHAGYTHAIIETSSHALTPETSRVAHVRYNGAIITNISSEHLEFHGTRARYRRAKARLLCMLRPESSASTVAQDSVYALSAANTATQRYLRRCARRCGTSASAQNIARKVIDYRIGVTTDPALRTEIIAETLERLTLRITVAHATVDINLPFCGAYNAENFVGALRCAHLLTARPMEEIALRCEGVTLPPGRLQWVSDPARHPYRVCVDYAHTAASLSGVLRLFRKHTVGRLVALFGSAGERDIGKRAAMGRVAAQYADIIYLSNEDPRNEDPASIAQGILRGIDAARSPNRPLPQTYMILDREQAIATAIGALQPGDTLLLMGKGHEQSVISGGSELPWDEVQIAKKYLYT